MEPESPSFWVDIKKYEETLEKDPNSYCFAPLSELYRKIGMFDDAIAIAKRGCELHPDYIGGYMALGRGYFEKGMGAEAKEALEKVVRVTPDNLLAQRILSKIYMDMGDTSSAEKSLNTILSQSPDDTESRMLLESLARGSAFMNPRIAGSDNSESDFPLEEQEYIIELLESDIVEEFEPADIQPLPGAAYEDYGKEAGFEEVAHGDEPLEAEEKVGKDPLNTVTLAELYIAQGFEEKALKIFCELSDADPENEELKDRILQLRQRIDEGAGRETEEETGSWSDTAFESTHGTEEEAPTIDAAPGSLDEGEAFTWPEDLAEESEPLIDTSESSVEQATFIPLVDVPPDIESANIVETEDMKGNEESSAASAGDNVVRTLEIWLENIKRRRQWD